MLGEVEKKLLKEIANLDEIPAEGAFSLRANGEGAMLRSTKNVTITRKTDKPGIDIHVAPGTVFESVHIPVVLTESGLNDVVYNDFYIGEGATVEIVAGCGIHNCGCDTTQHDGIHTFYVGKNASLTYVENHYGDGDGEGKRILNPQTIVYMEENAKVTMDTAQIRGVDDTKRYTKCVVGPGADLVITEKLLTHGSQNATSDMEVELNGDGAAATITSRSVAQDHSCQVFYPRLSGNCACFGHVTCDAIIMGESRVRAIPELTANHVDAQLIHEAAIGKIAGEQILKLMTLGLTAEEAEQQILDGFLR